MQIIVNFHVFLHKMYFNIFVNCIMNKVTSYEIYNVYKLFWHLNKNINHPSFSE